MLWVYEFDGIVYRAFALVKLCFRKARSQEKADLWVPVPVLLPPGHPQDERDNQEEVPGRISLPLAMQRAPPP